MLKKEFEQKYGSPKQQEFYREFFSRIPQPLMPYLSVRKFSYGETMILSSDRSKSVFFLMEGRVYAVEDRVQSLPYVFTELTPVEIIGDYELFSRMEGSYATIVAAGDCECVAMPADLYLRWISGDGKALFYRTSLLMNQLGGQAAAGRQYFFLDYVPRCASLLLQYAVPAGNGRFVLPINRESLAARMGCSLRTCHRAVADLKKRGLISLNRGKITVDEKQRERLRSYLEDELSRL